MTGGDFYHLDQCGWAKYGMSGAFLPGVLRDAVQVLNNGFTKLDKLVKSKFAILLDIVSCYCPRICVLAGDERIILVGNFINTLLGLHPSRHLASDIKFLFDTIRLIWVVVTIFRQGAGCIKMGGRLVSI